MAHRSDLPKELPFGVQLFSHDAMCRWAEKIHDELDQALADISIFNYGMASDRVRRAIDMLPYVDAEAGVSFRGWPEDRV